VLKAFIERREMVG